VRDNDDGGMKRLWQSTKEAAHGFDPSSGGADSNDWEEILCPHGMLLGTDLNSPIVAKVRDFNVE
jgi:hypothetical protein